MALAGDERPVSTDWVFPSLMALLCGWGVIFNLLTFRAGCGAEAFTVNYPTEGNEPDRPMSPCLTTIILTVFWITGAMMLGTVTGKGRINAESTLPRTAVFRRGRSDRLPLMRTK